MPNHVSIYKENGHLIIVKNVPCLVCGNCGETYVTIEVMQTLEKFIDTVQCSEVEIVSYNKIAA